MNNPRVSSIKKEQKESLLMKEISSLFLKASLDDPRLSDLFINRISLSPDKRICTVYFHTSKGLEGFKEKLEILKLYKPSLRKSISNTIKGKYVPDLKFAFDDQFEKQVKMEELMEKLKKEGQL